MNNKTYRALKLDLETLANRAVVDCNFTFTVSDGSAYDFSEEVGLFLCLYDRKDGQLKKQWTDTDGLSLTGNVITWNERDVNAMAFDKGKYYYEMGYTIVNYSTEDQLPLIFGDMKFI